MQTDFCLQSKPNLFRLLKKHSAFFVASDAFRADKHIRPLFHEWNRQMKTCLRLCTVAVHSRLIF
jgi:hypothetical protein